MIKMYCFGESGNAYKATLPLELSGLEWTPVYVDFFGGGARTPEFRAINQMGEVPVMIDGDTVLTQSGAIQDYIAEKSGKFGGSDPDERREILRWVLWDNHKMSSAAGMVRFLMNFMPADKRPEPVIEFMQHRLQWAYRILDTTLGERDWLVGDRPTMADFSCCGYLFYPEPFGFDRSAWPGIDGWLDRISNLDGWKHPYDLMPGNPSDRS